jgi:Fic family protein
VFRAVPVRILGTAHKPPEPYLVPEQIAALLKNLKDDHHHPIQRAVRFHLQFESIHPFIDGNGRTGRLLLNLMLLQSGYLPINIKYADRRRYYECFEVWDKTQDDQPMSELVAAYVQERLTEWLSIIDASPNLAAPFGVQ